MLVTLAAHCACIFDGFVCLGFFAIGTYELHLRISAINDKILCCSVLRPIKLQSKLEIYIIEHQNLCCKLKNFSEFLKHVYLAFLLMMSPATLITLHQILFERLERNVEVIYIVILIDCYLFFFVLQYFFASLSHKMHKQCKTISSQSMAVQWNVLSST